MINKNLFPQDQVLWYLNTKKPKQFFGNIKTNVVVIGGGMAGLSAAQSFAQKGKSVILLEKNFCGAGASGKSSGFITPDSELDLTFFKENFGDTKAKQIWDFVLSGVNLIKDNIKKYDINCDYNEEDTFVVASSKKSFKEISKEHKTRIALNYQSELYENDEVTEILGSNKYFGGVRYSNTFGIDAFLYCQNMKNILHNEGVKIFEECAAVAIDKNEVKTFYGNVQADHIIICVDRFLDRIVKNLSDYIYHAQTFIIASAPLKDEEVKLIFPKKNLMVWDTDLIYQYFRIFQQNRFLIGGGSVTSIFWGQEQHHNFRIYKKLSNYAYAKFPKLKFNWEYFWPGLIGVSKDVMPIADNLKENKNVYFVSAAAGLPWAAALGKYSAERIIDNNKHMDQYFTINRKFPVGNFAEKFLGKRLSFAISNLITLHK